MKLLHPSSRQESKILRLTEAFAEERVLYHPHWQQNDSAGGNAVVSIGMEGDKGKKKNRINNTSDRYL